MLLYALQTEFLQFLPGIVEIHWQCFLNGLNIALEGLIHFLVFTSAAKFNHYGGFGGTSRKHLDRRKPLMGNSPDHGPVEDCCGGNQSFIDRVRSTAEGSQ